MTPTEDTHVRRRPASLALRVTLLVGLATTLVFLAFNAVVVRALDQHFIEQDAGELHAVADAIADILQTQADGLDPAVLVSHLAPVAIGHHGVSYAVFDAQGKPLFASPGPDLSTLAAQTSHPGAANAPTLPVWREHGKSYRGTALLIDTAPPTAQRYRIAVAMDIDFHMEFLATFKRMLAWVTAAALLIALAVSWLAVQWGHRPIRKVSVDIRAIRSSRLDVRLNAQEVPIELQELALSFNDMLGRIEDGFARLSHFSADIAHELRTPVTNLITQTQVALSQPRPADEYREVLYSNLEELDRMSRMISDMLFLAQTENDPHSLHLSQTRLDTLIRGLFDYFEALAEEADLTLHLDGHADDIQADREMLMRALSNLLSNAIRYATRGSTIVVTLQQDAQSSTISVENPGEPIPADALPKLFDRFFRVDPARRRGSAGSGLGLAIVKSIAQAHGGNITASSTAGMTRFELRLPRLS